MNDFWVIDTEDDSKELCERTGTGYGKKVTQIAAVCSNGERYYNKGDALAFRTFLDSLGKCRVYAFNLQYDLGNIFANKLDAFGTMLVGSRMIGANWRKIEFRDAANIWQGTSVKKLGEIFDLKKLDFDAHSKDYVFRDCEIVVKAMQYVIDYFDDDNLPSTIGGLCVRDFERRGYTNWHDSDLTHKEAYFGGRVELFQKHIEGPVSAVDVNSLYPWALTLPFPRNDDFFKGKLCEYGIARVTIDVPKCWLAPLPVREPGGALVFPWGKLTGIWTCHEIRRAFQAGAVLKKVFWSIGGATGETYYREYILTHYQNRLNAKGVADKEFYKRLMNNLYGRLALSGAVTRAVRLTDEDFDGELYVGDGIAFGQRKLSSYQVDLPEFVNFLHAAYVTSYARIRLFDYMEKLGDKMIYCDTDSCFFTGHVVPFSIGPELGEMKLEGQKQGCYCHEPKVYEFGGEFKAKGVKRENARAFVEKGQVEEFRPFKYRESVTFYDRGNKKPLSVWRPVIKKRKGSYKRKEFKWKTGRYWPRPISEFSPELL